jgi:hypothetical protein
MTEAQCDQIADAIYRVEAPRYGNDIKPFDELGFWEQKKYRSMAEVAIRKWQALCEVDIGGSVVSQPG